MAGTFPEPSTFSPATPLPEKIPSKPFADSPLGFSSVIGKPEGAAKEPVFTEEKRREKETVAKDLPMQQETTGGEYEKAVLEIENGNGRFALEGTRINRNKNMEVGPETGISTNLKTATEELAITTEMVAPMDAQPISKAGIQTIEEASTSGELSTKDPTEHSIPTVTAAGNVAREERGGGEVLSAAGEGASRKTETLESKKPRVWTETSELSTSGREADRAPAKVDEVDVAGERGMEIEVFPTAQGPGLDSIQTQQAEPGLTPTLTPALTPTLTSSLLLTQSQTQTQALTLTQTQALTPTQTQALTPTQTPPSSQTPPSPPPLTPEETPAGNREGTKRSHAATLSTALTAYTVQCSKCFKWRRIPTLEEYEGFRAHISQNPFVCEKARRWRPSVSCEDPTDLEQDGSLLWAMDRSDIPQPPPGWRRRIVVRGGNSNKFSDVYYYPPEGKSLRSMNDVERFLSKHPAYAAQGITKKQFSFSAPRPLNLATTTRSPSSKASPNNGEGGSTLAGSNRTADGQPPSAAKD